MRYLKIRNGKFYFVDKVIGPQIEAQIKVVGKRFLRWINNNLVGERPCQNEYNLPDGWTLAYDLDLVLDDVPHRLTIQGGVIQYAFKPYLAYISSNNLILEHTTTRVTVDDSKNGHASLRFENASKRSLF